jgi:probable rRNA maturation factor
MNGADQSARQSSANFVVEPKVDAIDPEPPSQTGSHRLELELIIDFEDDDPGELAWQSFGDLEAAVTACQGSILAERLRELTAPAAAAVALTSDDVVRRLNKTYRGKDAPTNVLSFPTPILLEPHLDGVRLLGDVVLALETVQREAAEQGIPPLFHLQHLVVHGVLHLLGYDHETEADALVMESLETKILARVGIPDPYAGASVDLRGPD